MTPDSHRRGPRGKLLPAKEASAVVGLGPRPDGTWPARASFYRLVERGDVGCYHVGGRMLFDEQELREWLASRYSKASGRRRRRPTLQRPSLDTPATDAVP
jgi:hypothetical protein